MRREPSIPCVVTNAHWCSSTDTIPSSSGIAWAISRVFFAGIRNFPWVPLFGSGIFFSASLNESVATAVSTPPSMEMYILDNSGRMVDVDAHEAIEVNKFFRRTPGRIILFFGFSGNGISGKSSYGIVFMRLLLVPLMIDTTSPVCSMVISPSWVMEVAICWSTTAGIATTPSVIHFPFNFKSIPVSRFVARIFIPSFPAIIRMEESIGSVVVFRSAKRATLYTASENSFFSIEIFIQCLLGVLIL